MTRKSTTSNARCTDEELSVIFAWRQNLPDEDKRIFDAMLANARSIGLDYYSATELVAKVLLRVKR